MDAERIYIYGFCAVFFFGLFQLYRWQAMLARLSYCCILIWIYVQMRIRHGKPTEDIYILSLSCVYSP